MGSCRSLQPAIRTTQNLGSMRTTSGDFENIGAGVKPFRLNMNDPNSVRINQGSPSVTAMIPLSATFIFAAELVFTCAVLKSKIDA